MDSFAAPPAAEVDAGFRDPRYAPRRLEVEHRPDGAWLLHNPTPWDASFTTTLQALDRWAVEQPTRVWLAERSGAGWRTVTYAEAAERVAALSGGLAGLALTVGDRLLILARNGVDHALVSYAAMALGAAACPVSPQYALGSASAAVDLRRLEHAVALLKPVAVMVDDATAYAAALAAPCLAGLPVIVTANAAPGQHTVEQLARSAPAPRADAPDLPAKVLLTSGSTGGPKGVVQLHRAIAANAAQIAACFADPDPLVTVSSAPWSHSLGANAILHMTLHRGGTLYIDGGAPTPARFGETLRNVGEVEATYLNMVPAGWAMLADALEGEGGARLAHTLFARVRVMQYGGASLAQSVVDRIQAAAVRAVGEKISWGTGYGSTETGPTACNIHWPNGVAGSIGLPVPGTTLKLAPEGAKYEARVRGPQIFAGYLDAPERTAGAFDEEGFYRLGDAVRFTEPGVPESGLMFDGRLVENFKLASGTFVAAGALRVAALSAIGGAAADAIVCGEGEAGVGLLLFRNRGWAGAADEAAVRAAVLAGLQRLNAAGGATVVSALLLEDAPDFASGELTDKGYLNQALARSRRPDAVAALFDPTEPSVIRPG